MGEGRETLCVFFKMCMHVRQNASFLIFETTKQRTASACLSLLLFFFLVLKRVFGGLFFVKQFLSFAIKEAFL